MAVAIHVGDGQQDAGCLRAAKLAALFGVSVRSAVENVEAAVDPRVVPHHHHDQVQIAVAGKVCAVDGGNIAGPADIQGNAAHALLRKAVGAAMIPGQVAAHVVHDHVQPAVAVQVRDAGVALGVGGQDGGALAGETLGRPVEDHRRGGHGGGFAVVRVSHGQQVEPAVPVEVAHLHVMHVLPPAEEARKAVGSQAVRSAVEQPQPLVTGGTHQVGMAVLIEVGDDIGVGAAGGKFQPSLRVEVPLPPRPGRRTGGSPDRAVTGRPWCC